MTGATGEGSESGLGASAESRLEALLESFVARCRRGEHPSISEFEEKAPELAKSIREAFPALELLEKVRGSGAEGSNSSAVTGEPPASQAPRVRRLGEYRLIREVGRGGMGVVYEAEQESLGRRVALKVLPFHSLMDERRLERFRREARAAAGLQHPGIVPVYGLGSHEGVHYFAMHFVDGESIEKILPEVKRISSGGGSSPSGGSSSTGDSSTAIALGLLSGSFDPPTSGTESAASRSPREGLLERQARGEPLPAYYSSIARLACQAAGALSYAHGKGIIHRDIKPSNLLVDTEGNAWIADFGLAKVLEEDDLTRTGEIVGTIRYMAPEQFRGRFDPRSDIYSLGLTLYELATLTPAFQAEDRDKLWQKVTADSPPPPRMVEPRVPRALESIVLKAIQRDPEARYSSAAEMAGDLERYIGGRRIRGRLQGPGYPFVRRHRVALAAVALAILLGGLAAGAVLLAHRPLMAMRVIARDLDGDGKTDLAILNAGSGSVTIARGDGKGGFSVDRHFQVGIASIGMAVVDLDGDGRPDIAVSDYRSMDVTVLRNRGAGDFERAGMYAVGAGANFLDAGDLDGDGRADLVVAAMDSRLHLFRNLGGARFEETAPVPLDPSPNIPLVADLDGDGDMDLAVTCSQDLKTTKMVVLLNRGRGTFSKTTYEVGLPSEGLAAQDLDGDGAPDLVLTHIDSNTISILRNKDRGEFAEPARIGISAPGPWNGIDEAQWVACGDLDGDRIPDLAAAGGDGSFACVLLGRGRCEFGPAKILTAGKAPSSIEMADLDGDGHLDLAVSNYGSSDITLFLGDGKGNFDRKRTLDLAPWWRPRFLSQR